MANVSTCVSIASLYVTIRRRHGTISDATTVASETGLGCPQCVFVSALFGRDFMLALSDITRIQVDSIKAFNSRSKYLPVDYLY